MDRSPDRPDGPAEPAVYESPAWKLQQTDLVYAGLVGIAIVFVQEYVGMAALDTAANVSLLAFAIALPLLAALGVLNALQAGYRYAPFQWWMTVALIVALGASAVGIVAAFWRVSPVAGVLVIVTGLLSAVLIGGYRISLEKANPVS